MNTPRRFFPYFTRLFCILAALAGCLTVARSPLAAAEPDPNEVAETRLVAVGALSATSMVASQSFLGVVADGLVEGLYKKAEEVQPDLDLLASSLEGSLKAVEQVSKQKLTEADKKFLDDIRSVFTLQQTQAQALVAYAASKDQADLRRWKTARDDAQAHIDELLGLNETPRTVFENVKEKLNPALQAKFVSFHLLYPESWTADVGVGSGDGAAFFRATSTAEEDNKKYLLEQLSVGPLLLKAEITKENEAALLKEKVAQLAAQVAKDRPQAKKTKEGVFKIGAVQGYGFEFTDVDQKPGEDDTDVFGRVVLVPPSQTKQPNGLLITLLGTAHTEGIDAAADLGVKGELPILIESFGLGPAPKPAADKAPPTTAPAPAPAKP